jgi:hypothetical protein
VKALGVTDNEFLPLFWVPGELREEMESFLPLILVFKLKKRKQPGDALENWLVAYSTKGPRKDLMRIFARNGHLECLKTALALLAGAQMIQNLLRSACARSDQLLQQEIVRVAFHSCIPPKTRGVGNPRVNRKETSKKSPL